MVDEETWNNRYKDILSETFSDRERLAEQESEWGEPDEEGRGSFVLKRLDEPTEEDKPASSNLSFKGGKQ